MADLVKVSTSRNGISADATINDGAASQTIPYDRSDENIVIRVTNSDANPATITAVANGYGGQAADDLDMVVAQNEVKYIGALESMYYKDPATQKVTLLVTDADGSAFSGTITNVKFEVIELPKSLVN